MDIDAVERRLGNLAQVSLDDARRPPERYKFPAVFL
jgi:hypothetical protein